jgi:hypothetical protein
MNSLFLSDVKFHWSVVGPALIWKRLRRSRKIPNLISPKTFNEKILHRILFDRRDFIPLFSGKLESRQYVLDKTGDSSLLIELVGTARNTAELRQLQLPEKFIAKSNHMSGRTWIHDGTVPLRIEELGNSIAKWCSELGKLQWGYSKVQRVALVEHLIESENGIPEDYKFFCYNGRVHYIQVDGSRFSGHRRDFFDTDWNHIDAVLSYQNAASPPDKPQTLRRMIQLAEQLSAGGSGSV